MIAIVGSRRATPYGLRMAREMTLPLARAGLVIVSGLAFGIDEAAHEAAMDAGGRTIAVLASGVDKTTPTEHIPLAERILNYNGAIISEFPDGTPAYKQNFPIRNRIIAGMCLATMVIEATDQSGSLITAAQARDSGREVFSMPGPIDSENSRGTNGLIKTGAHLLTCANDVLDLLEFVGLDVETPREPVTADTKEEALLLPLLSRKPKHMDDLIRESGLTAQASSTSMSLMEIKGKIRHVGGNHYIIS